MHRLTRFKTVRGSIGASPSFSIQLGLKDTRKGEENVHTINQVISLISTFLKKKAQDGKPYLVGVVTNGTAVYVETEDEVTMSSFTPQVIYSGNINPLYNVSMSSMNSRPIVEKFLNDLASHLASVLGQAQVFVTFHGDMWTLSKDEE